MTCLTTFASLGLRLGHRLQEAILTARAGPSSTFDMFRCLTSAWSRPLRPLLVLNGTGNFLLPTQNGVPSSVLAPNSDAKSPY